jgi:hypothetical protein
MSDQSVLQPPAFDQFSSDYAKQQGLDFFSFHSPSDILAPHPDLFESELDSSLAAFDEVQLQLLTVDSNDAFSYLRSDTPTCGPPSTITVSSESAYDSVSSRSDYYNYPHSPYAPTNYSFPLDLEMDFQRIRVDNVSDYGVGTAQQTTVDPNSFGALPPTPPRSPPVAPTFEHRSSFSDYGGVRPGRMNSSPVADYYSHLGYGAGAQTTVSPAHVNSQLPVTPSVPHTRSLRGVEDESKDDARKKYRCPACPRGKYIFNNKKFWPQTDSHII